MLRRLLPSPESFIWHYIEQCVRAYAYLYGGIIEGKPVGGKDWVPIVHRDSNEDNIIFHFPDADYLSEQSEQGRKKAEAFPQVILVDLGMANRVDDPVEVHTDGKFDTPGVHEWEDVVLFGERLRELLYTSFDSFPPLRDARLAALYSDELLTAVERLTGPADVVWGADTAHLLPDWRWIFREVLPIAFRKIKEYIAKEDLESMLWARPTPTTNMPYHVTPIDKDGLRALRKQGAYWEAVEFYFDTLEVDKVEELPDCLDANFDLRPAPQVPPASEFFETVEDAAKRLERAADVREQEHLSYGGTSDQWMNDIKAVRGILPILEQVYQVPDDSDAASSSEKGTAVDESSDSDPSDDAAGGPSPSDPSGNASARCSKSTPSKSPFPASLNSAAAAGAVITKKRARSRSTNPSMPEKRRKIGQVRETIVTNTYITRVKDLDINEK